MDSLEESIDYKVRKRGGIVCKVYYDWPIYFHSAVDRFIFLDDAKRFGLNEIIGKSLEHHH